MVFLLIEKLYKSIITPTTVMLFYSTDMIYCKSKNACYIYLE